MANVTVRPLQLSDFEGVRKVDDLTQHQYLQEKWEKFSSVEKEEHLVTRRSEFNSNVQTGYGFVTIIGNEIIGFILAYENLPFRDTVYIRHIAIKPEFQGRSLGVHLFNAVIDKAKRNGIKKVWSMINLDNPKSIRLHEKLGFTLSDRKEAIFHLNRRDT